MQPTLQPGDYMMAVRGAAPERGQVVVFRHPRDNSTTYVSRIIGLPGDRVQLRNGVVYLNGEAVPRQAIGRPQSDADGQTVQGFRETLPEGRSYVVHDMGPQAADNTAVYVVPARCYFMLSDNRDNALDSRFNPGFGASASPSGPCAWTLRTEEEVGYQAGTGFVPEQNLAGRPAYVVFSWDEENGGFRAGRVFAPVR